MVKEFYGTYAFPFTWDQVVSCFWVKYPNPFSKHVLSEDVFCRFLTEKNVLITRKLLVKERTFHVPKWAEKFITMKNVYVVEESHCDPENKILTSYTKNFSSNSFMVSAGGDFKYQNEFNVIYAFNFDRLLLKSAFIRRIQKMPIELYAVNKLIFIRLFSVRELP